MDVRLLVLAGDAGHASLSGRLPAYARSRPDKRVDQRERLEANAALVVLWSAAAGVAIDGDAWTQHDGGAPRPPAFEPHLSLSHTRGLAALALCADAHVGVDVERPRGCRHVADVASGAFGTEELERWRDLPPDAREEGLLVAWTRKEAVLKALGTGLAGGLRSVVFDADGALCALPPQAGKVAGWTLAGLALGNDAWGAVAVRHPSARIVVRGPESVGVLLGGAANA